MSSEIKQDDIFQTFVSVIVLNYNGMRYLKKLFESLSTTIYPKDCFEIIMGDNGSIDNSVKYIEENFPCVKVLKLGKNYGFCKGNNLCAKEAKGQYLVFLNTDTIVTADWLRNLVAPVIKDKTVISAGAKLLKPYKADGKKIIDYAGGKLTYEINFYEGQLDFDCKKYSFEKQTGFGCGAAVLVESTFFAKIGGFDEYYFGGGEEVEIGLRAWQCGYKVLYVPSSVIYHLRYGTFNPNDSFPTYNWVKSMFYYVLKNYEPKNIIVYLSESIIFTQFPKMLAFIFNKNLSMAKAVIMGMVDFLVDLKRENLLSTIYQKRVDIQASKKVSDSDLAKSSISTTFSERMMYRVKSYFIWKSGKYFTKSQ
jgi:GT2 family glycosyltransferase